MNTKWFLSAAMAAALGASLLAMAGCRQTNDSEHAHQYTCKHHPEVMRDTPGNCPKCGMKLVEKH